MTDVYIGTSGYSYQDWIGYFYQYDTKKSDILTEYSKEFAFTEINSTYYKLPNAYLINNLIKKTPESFQFSVKLHQTMTHSRDADSLIYKNFKEAIQPMLDRNSLSCLVAQFPYSFHNNQDNMNYIRYLKDEFKDIPMAVEWRNNEWICQASFKLLKELDLSYTCVDEPNIKGLVKPVVVATNSLGYIRFHGRNKSKWYNNNAPYERYDYLYTDSELKEWIPRIKTLRKHTERLYIAFNNHFRAQSVRNAQMLSKLIANS